MNDESEKPSTAGRKLAKFLAGGSEIAGAAIGGALGWLAAGPEGAAAGSAGGAVAKIAIDRIGQEISDRWLAPRERVRAGGVLALAGDAIRKRIEAGESIRNDGFFDLKNGERSDAEEVIESIVSRAQREPQEKKLPYMANMLSSIAFDNDVSVDLAHQIIKSAEQLTYRQLCIMALTQRKAQYNLRSSSYRGQASISKDTIQVIFEIQDLYNLSYLYFGGEASLGVADVNPSAMNLQGVGADLYNAMRLWEMPASEINPVAAVLS